MNRRLPPIASLVAFDAVVRHRSFTRAAEELSVTQSAISHQIKRLEEFFGTQLLKRLNPGIELSGDGAKLHEEVVPVLDAMAGLEQRMHHRQGLQQVRVGAGSSLANWWLLRRLRKFRSLHPEVEIDFVPYESTATEGPSVDVRMLWVMADGARATSTQAPLAIEQVFPVCSPSILPRGMPLDDPADLLNLPLIQKGHAPSGEWSWTYWFDKLGLERAEPRGLIVGDIGLCLTSAVDGAGVAIGRSMLVADAIADGKLVPVLAATPYVQSAKIYVARWAVDLEEDSNTRFLVRWLCAEVEDTNREVDLRLNSYLVERQPPAHYNGSPVSDVKIPQHRAHS